MAAPLVDSDLIPRAEDKEFVLWDNEKGIIATSEKRIGNVVLFSKPLLNVSNEHRIDILVKAFQSEGLKLLSWNDDIANGRRVL